MRWLFRLFGFVLDCLWAVPVAIWRGLTGYVPPDPWQQAAEREVVQDEADLNAETERLLAQMEEAEHRLRERKAAKEPLFKPGANDDYDLELEEEAERGLSLAM